MSGLESGDVTAILLVAGMGRRLGKEEGQPKVLMEFGGKTLLERHFQALGACGVNRFALTVGYKEEAIRREVDRLGLTKNVHYASNPRYREGSLISLWEQRDVLRGGGAVLLMDGDVLYPDAMLSRLLAAEGENILLVDRDIEPGDEPVKICFHGGRIVDFRKKPDHAHEWHGESVGFFRFSAATAAALADRCEARLGQDDDKTEYEEAIRDLILTEPDRFSATDVTDLPWTEIDFDVDVIRARDTILPRLDH